ncbi:hypothetical protein [Luteolibacter sp. Populi]|uniref:hypothetical protein n=1 Tax=Luteolibacter sp. Populi TaxID=3230487 RepID=UPI00346724B2
MRRLIVDTNLLLLLVVGSTGLELIGKHKRTRVFTTEDFLLLEVFLEGFKEIVVTPGILAEVSNLSAQIGEPLRSSVMHTVGRLIASVRENHVAGVAVVDSRCFVRLGLVDASILEVYQDGDHLLTDDLDLWIEAVNSGKLATNFTHLRAEHLLG